MNALFTIKVNDNLANKMEILRVKKVSMYNLFTSYMNDRFELFDDFKLDSFIDDYALACLEYDSLIYGELHKNISENDFLIITAPCKKYCINFNYLTKEIVVVDKQFCSSNLKGGN